MTGEPLPSWDLEEGDEIAPGLSALKRLGGGTRYDAYLAFSGHLHAVVVAKVVRPHLVDEERVLRGLTGEWEMLERLNHPVIMRGFHAVLEGPRPHVVVEHLEGPRLSSLVRRYGPLPAEIFWCWLEGIAQQDGSQRTAAGERPASPERILRFASACRRAVRELPYEQGMAGGVRQYWRRVHKMPGATTFDRVIVAAVAILIGAFTLGALGPLVTPASGDNVNGARDDEVPDVVLTDEEDHDGDDPLARGGDTGGDTSRKASRNSGSRSIGSHSANTRTGSTNNTGKSRSVSNSSGASKNTKTGTSRGTGKSATVSNSS